MESPKDSATENLIQRIIAQDQLAFYELLELYETKVYNLIYRLLSSREDTEEVLQEVFWTVYSKLSTFRGESSLSSWIYRITVNMCYMRLRKKQIQTDFSINDIVDVVDNGKLQNMNEWSLAADQLLLNRELVEKIEEALDVLPADYRVVLMLRDVNDLSNSEVATILGLTVPAVKSRLHRARLILRRKISTYLRPEA
jgi:RNA polymerase sigma-70 factor (ECF subfamily)